jgi:hypothetical protein
MSNMPNKLARDTYVRLFDDLSALLFRHDPIGINFATNTDEYNPEARTILPRLPQCHSAPDVPKVIVEEFHRWFGEALSPAKLIPCARPLNSVGRHFDLWARLDQLRRDASV